MIIKTRFSSPNYPNQYPINPLRAAVEKSRQWGTSSSHGGQENSTEKHQPVSEGISWEPRIVSSHTAPQKIAKKISFQVTENDRFQTLTSPFSILLNVPTFPKTSDTLYFVQSVGGTAVSGLLPISDKSQKWEYCKCRRATYLGS